MKDIKKIVIASNAFKGSLDSYSVASNIEIGIKRVLQGIKIIKLSISDGGDGTLDTLMQATGGTIIETCALDPIRKKINCNYGVLRNGTGVVEMALVSGLALLDSNKLNTSITTSYGTGQLIKELLDKGITRIIIGIGGSATTDCGCGMAEALGIKFYDKADNLLEMTGEKMCEVVRIDMSGVDKRIASCNISVACDINNPLFGENGAAYIYSKQKGATMEQIEQLDSGLINISSIMKKDYGIDNAMVNGVGAAGGMGYGLMSFLGASLNSGIDTILNAIDFEKHLEGADLVFTGEGAIDYQSAYGKVPAGVAKLAKARNIPVIVIAGGIGEGVSSLYDIGITSCVTIAPAPCTLEYCLQNAPRLVADASERVMRIIIAL